MRLFSAPLYVWRWLTDPHRSVAERTTQLQARAVSGITLVGILNLSVISLFSSMPVLFPIEFLITFILLAISYVFSRTRWFRYAGGLTIATLWALALIIAGSPLSIAQHDAAMAILHLSTLILLIALVLYSLRFMLLLIGLALVTMIALSAIEAIIPEFVSELVLLVLTFSLIFYVLYDYDRERSKLTRAALDDSEYRYRAVTEDQSEMICRWLPDYTVIFVNDAYVRTLNRPRDEIMRHGVLHYIDAEFVPQIEALLATISPDNPTVMYEQSIDIDGENRWLQWIDRAIFAPDGRVMEYQSVGRDVTALRRAQEAEADERRFAEMLSVNAALINRSLNPDLTMDSILQQAMMLENVDAADICLIEDGFVRLVRTRGYERFDDGAFVKHFNGLHLKLFDFPSFARMVETMQPVLTNDILNDHMWSHDQIGEWMRAYVGAPVTVDAEVIGFLNIVSTRAGAFSLQTALRLQAFANQAGTALRNARLYETVRKYADDLESLVHQRTQQLTVTTQRLSAILNSTGDGIFYSEGNSIQYVNDVLCAMTGYKESELLNTDVRFLQRDDLSPEQKWNVVTNIVDAVRQQGIWRGEIRAQRKDGSTFDAALTVTPIGSFDAKPLRAVTVVRDISQEKVLAEQRAQFIAHASHELRTPITNLKTRLYLARRRPEQWDQHLEILDRTTEWMTQLVQDLLDISRMERGLIPLERAIISVQEIAQTVATMQTQEAERAGLLLTVRLDPTPLLIFADRARIIQVVTNLVTNAINYTPAGGSVEIIVERDDDHYASLYVIDSGIGIKPEDQKLIFQPFYRVPSKVAGTGLGLSIVSQIVEQHSGTITVESQPERGSRFMVRLPLHIEMHDFTSTASV